MCKEGERDFSKLLGRIKEKGLTQETVARLISRNPCTFSQKVHNRGIFTAAEIEGICNILEIDTGEIGAYFFTPKVQKVGIFENPQEEVLTV